MYACNDAQQEYIHICVCVYIFPIMISTTRTLMFAKNGWTSPFLSGRTYVQIFLPPPTIER